MDNEKRTDTERWTQDPELHLCVETTRMLDRLPQKGDLLVAMRGWDSGYHLMELHVFVGEEGLKYIDEDSGWNISLDLTMPRELWKYSYDLDENPALQEEEAPLLIVEVLDGDLLTGIKVKEVEWERRDEAYYLSKELVEPYLEKDRLFNELEDIEERLETIRQRRRQEIESLLKASREAILTLEMKEDFVRRLKRVLHVYEYQLICPKCENPAILRVSSERSEEGRFQFAHVSGKRTVHGNFEKIPEETTIADHLFDDVRKSKGPKKK